MDVNNNGFLTKFELENGLNNLDISPPVTELEFT